MFLCVYVAHCTYAYVYTDAHTFIQVFIIQDQCLWTLELLLFQDAMLNKK